MGPNNAATERSPLLTEVEPIPESNGSESQPRAEESYDTPLVEEPSTKRLVLTLGSIWVGVFLSALG